MLFVWQQHRFAYPHRNPPSCLLPILYLRDLLLKAFFSTSTLHCSLIYFHYIFVFAIVVQQLGTLQTSLVRAKSAGKMARNLDISRLMTAIASL